MHFYLISLAIFTLLLSCQNCFASYRDHVIYKINLNSINDTETIKKGSELSLFLDQGIFTRTNKITEPVSLTGFDGNKNPVNATGLITKISNGGILSKRSSVQLSINNLRFDNGEELTIAASSPQFVSIHSPHANTRSLQLAHKITNLSLATSPFTFGASLGISFLTAGLLSAYQNGIGDFIWGGLDGSGFSFLESLFRKQPETYLSEGAAIPFRLTQDIKVSTGIKTEPVESVHISQEEAVDKIETLLRRGDLAGALEFSIKTNQKGKFDELIKKISS